MMDEEVLETSILRDKGLISAFIVLFIYIVLLIIVAIPLSIVDMPMILLVFLNFILTGMLVIGVFVYGLGLPASNKSISEFFKDIRLVNVKDVKRDTIIGFSIGIVFILNMLIINQILPRVSEINLEVLIDENSYSAIFPITAAVWEEVIFRGIILFLLLKKYKPLQAILIDGVLFGTAHGINVFFGQPPMVALIQFVSGLIIGVFLCYIVIKTDNLWPAIIIHHINNAFSPVFLEEIYSSQTIEWNEFIIVNLGTLITCLILILVMHYADKMDYIRLGEEHILQQ